MVTLSGTLIIISRMEWIQSHHDWTIHEDDIIFYPGVVPALNLAVLVTSSVIILNPELRSAFSQLIEKMHLGIGNLFGYRGNGNFILHIFNCLLTSPCRKIFLIG